MKYLQKDSLVKPRELSMHDFLKGTFVASILTLDKAYLFSDGIVTLNHPDHPTRQVSDSFSKVHKINSHCGILTYGRFLPDLVELACTQIKDEDNLEQIRTKFKLLFTNLWKKAPKTGVKTGAIIVTFNRKRTPCCFVVESTSTPEFEPGPLNLPSDYSPITLGAVCHDEAQLQSCKRLTVELQGLINMGFQMNRDMFRKAFDNVKEQLSKVSHEIGGKTFELVLEK